MSLPLLTIRSAAFPNVYIRMDGRDRPFGVVNCQFGVVYNTPDLGPGYEFVTIELQADGTVAIGSYAFPGCYLRLDGSGVTQPVDTGGGVVNCEFHVGPFEKYRMHGQPDGSIALESVAFPGCYLRLDGSGVTQPVGAGGGVVNCQFGVGPFEKFFIHSLYTRIYSIAFPGISLRMVAEDLTEPVEPGGGVVEGTSADSAYSIIRFELQADGTVAIGSYEFPGCYLRLDARGITQPMEEGGGIVNCQFGVGPFEKFRVHGEVRSRAFESAAFPGCYLRLDGRGVSYPSYVGGVVNCQFGVGPWERFHAQFA
jgi:hypothetical protein